MERIGGAVEKPQIGTDSQYEFHEFVRGCPEVPTALDKGTLHPVQLASSVGSVPAVPRPPSDSYEVRCPLLETPGVSNSSFMLESDRCSLHPDLDLKAECSGAKIEAVDDKEEVRPLPSTDDGPYMSNQLSVDTKVALNSHSAGSLSECGVCGPEKAIWVPQVSEGDEPLIEPISEHGQTVKIDPVDIFWIQCDCCEKWFHGSCVGVEEYEDVLIDKFHCPSCAVANGPTIMKKVLLDHRYAFDDVSQSKLPPEIGTKVWIKNFVETEAKIPSVTDNHAIICENGFEFMDDFNRKADWKKIYLIKEARGLEMRVPEKSENFGLGAIVEIFGRPFRVDTIDVFRQVTHSMSIGSFYDKMIDKERPRLYNILSLEFSQNEAMRKMVSPPILVPELSFVHKLWPDKNDLINWDPELDYLPSSMKVRQIVEVLEEHRRNKPEVALFCLCGMAGSYTDFHIDFGGSSVWYHIYEGQKIFYVVEPTDQYLNLFEDYQRSDSKTEVFFGDLLPKGALRRVVIDEGQTLMIPSGWIHAVYTPVDSLVFGGNFLHALNVPMQLRVYDMEQRLKKDMGTEDKYLFPHFELVNWYAARSFILESLREANDEGNRADRCIMDAAQALLPRLKEWMRRDKEDKAKFTHSSFNDVLAKLQKEINKQQRLRRSLSPGSRSPQKKSKKRKSSDEDQQNPGDVNRAFASMTSSSPKVSKASSTQSVSSPAADDAREEIRTEPMKTPLTLETDSEAADFRIKITKKGKSYESEVVDKPDPMLEDVNMIQMFARRSSSGRKPRPAAWLAAAVGVEELEKTSKRLEECGEQLPPREVVSYDAEMERACEEEEAEMLREMNKKKGKDRIGPPVGSSPLFRATEKKKKPCTAKQRLAAKLKLK
ncbi:hypothetical protein Q1695_004962 [Nippostrongylus brasiliensis]|nr:hypothetical protein Q1695_004962 [Nippostrongylus brasiliensis]